MKSRFQKAQVIFMGDFAKVKNVCLTLDYFINGDLVYDIMNIFLVNKPVKTHLS